MDLTTIDTVLAPTSPDDLPPPGPGTAFLAGGTWLFSEPQPAIHTLVDLAGLRWPALAWTASGLRIGAMCTIAELAALETDVPAGPLFAGCCRALLGSFKIWNAATVGGNVCLALPAAPMLALTVALDGMAIIHPTAGDRAGGGYTLPMADFALGPQRTALAAGDVLSAIDIPAAALRRRTAHRQASLTAHGRSAALLVATRDDAGDFSLTITASTTRPINMHWQQPPGPAALDAAIAGLPADIWFDDVHGAPAWRRHMTRRLAAELLNELAA